MDYILNNMELIKIEDKPSFSKPMAIKILIPAKLSKSVEIAHKIV